MSDTPVTAEDLYLYAMGLMDQDENARLDAFLQQSPEARAELINVRSDLGLLALSVESEAPSIAARQRFIMQIAREPRTAAPEPISVVKTPVLSSVETDQVEDHVSLSTDISPIRPQAATARSEGARPDPPLPFRSMVAQEQERKNNLATAFLPWLGWAVAAGLTVTAWDFHTRTDALTNQVRTANATAQSATASSARAQMVLDTMRSPSAQRFQLTRQNTQPIPSARVTYVADSGALIFQGSNMEPLPTSKTYELWLIPAGKGQLPIPAGTFKPDERGFASIIMPELPRGIAASTFGVTMEDDGGAQTPTMPILMIGS